MRTPARSPAARAGREHRDAGHHSALAPRAAGAQVDVSRRPLPPCGLAGTPRSARHSDGDREPHIGLYAHSRCVEEPGPPRRPFDDRAHPARRGHSARSATPDDMANVRAGALVGARGSRLLHHGGMDRARMSDVRHGVRARGAVAACTGGRLHAVSGRSLRHSMSAADHG